MYHLCAGPCAAVAMYGNHIAILSAMETEGLELDLLSEDAYADANADASKLY